MVHKVIICDWLSEEGGTGMEKGKERNSQFFFMFNGK